MTARAFLIPEVIQTSAMDCGPAALYGTLSGHGIRVDYDRLRERCQTDVDGASIDTLEELAIELGLDAQQTILPADHLFLDEAHALPALVVVRLPSGNTHFVVLWRRHGKRVQVMDPGARRHFTHIDEIRSQLFIHGIPFDPEVWRQWADENEFHEPVRRRILQLRVGQRAAGELVQQALADPSWFPLAALDAATRYIHLLVDSRAIRRGAEAERALRDVFARAVAAGPGEWRESIPPSFWSAFPHEEGIAYRGAVLVRFRGASETPAAARAAAEAMHSETEPETMRRLIAMAWRENPSALAGVASGLLITAIAAAIEAMLFRGVIAFGAAGSIPEQALGAILAVLVFSIVLAITETALGVALLRVGNRLEAALRIALLTKLPRLRDSYLQTRLRSDMAERCHSVSPLRKYPELHAHVARTLLRLTVVTFAICWIAPSLAVAAIGASVVAVLVPLLAHPSMAQADMRARTHAGALTRFYLDTLLGLTPLRAHGAASAIRRQHEELLAQWRAAVQSRISTAVVSQGVQLALCLAAAAWIVTTALTSLRGSTLLLVYWALMIPTIALALSQRLRLYPRFRSVGVRLVEILQADESSRQLAVGSRQEQEADAGASGVVIDFEGVTVSATGHTLIEDVDLRIEAGEHVVIVGASGAGKSTLVGLLLGWHRAASGAVLIDGVELGDEQLQQLRGETAWVDPAVQLWNRSLLENLEYGNTHAARPAEAILGQAELLNVLESLPDGLQTRLGESGALMSGGEGQRVRFGRALGRDGARLVILDEAFRGLDRPRRNALLARARELWRGVTLLYVTHDLEEARLFERVLVVDHGHIVEDGAPAALESDPASRYAELRAAQEQVTATMSSTGEWRRLTLRQGRLNG
jgi:ABC-type bacteriocin/lantibiotic exporter with double-glycine peptidase domain